MAMAQGLRIPAENPAKPKPTNSLSFLVLFSNFSPTETKKLAAVMAKLEEKNPHTSPADETKEVEDLAHISFQTNTATYIDVDEGRTKVTNEGVQQGYCVVSCGRRFILLYSFLKRNLSKKDWILQYPPDDPKEYIHRVGRTARGERGKGNALLFLIPEELQFLTYLKAAKVPVKEYEFDQKKLANVQSHQEKLVGNNYYLNKAAKDAYRSYLLAYNSHSMKNIFNVHRLDLQAPFSFICYRKTLELRYFNSHLGADLVNSGIGQQ